MAAFAGQCVGEGAARPATLLVPVSLVDKVAVQVSSTQQAIAVSNLCLTEISFQ